MARGNVIVGLSGGVDSSVAALLLKQQGWNVQGLFMKNWEEDDTAEYCAAREDMADASAVAECIGIRLHTVNFAAEYWDRVFALFLDEYRAGRTPNPDVLCNREIKFRAFLEHALDLGADHIATGHYAGIDCDAAACRLTCARDANKDQTYFLYMLGQRALRHSLFPLRDLPKGRVRQLARDAGLPNHERKDSTGICFIGERRFRDFLKTYLPANPGEIRTDSGRLVGRHNGLMYYTPGQRQGLGIGGVRGAPDAPWFVVDKDLTSNTLIVGQGHDHPGLLQDTLEADQLHWISGASPGEHFNCEARCRHRQPRQACTVKATGSGVRVQFARPQRALAPGQSVVFYTGDLCLGGGIIDRAFTR